MSIKKVKYSSFFIAVKITHFEIFLWNNLDCNNFGSVSTVGPTSWQFRCTCGLIVGIELRRLDIH
jgi:hypothetical protein